MKYKISVIVPVYNVELYLERCLESIVKQTLTDIQIIIVNDGSTDNSLDIIKKYAQYDDRFIVVSQENRGSSAARNKGLKIASGDFIAFVDGDDYISSEMYMTMYNSAIKNSADVVVCQFSKFNDQY